jgi:hypothetical protein
VVEQESKQGSLREGMQADFSLNKSQHWESIGKIFEEVKVVSQAGIWKRVVQEGEIASIVTLYTSDKVVSVDGAI